MLGKGQHRAKNVAVSSLLSVRVPPGMRVTVCSDGTDQQLAHCVTTLHSLARLDAVSQLDHAAITLVTVERAHAAGPWPTAH